MGGPFNKQHDKRAEALLKSSSAHFYDIHWSLPRQLSWKKSLLLTCKILGLLLNTLAADEKYPVLNRKNVTIPIQMQLSQKQKIFSEFFAAYLKSRLNFKYFDQKDDPYRFLLPILWTMKTWSDKCLKSAVSEDLSTSSMVNVPKDCWNLHHSTVMIFIDPC